MVATKQKKRGQVNRSRTKLILIGTEGRNKTEKIYFNEFFRSSKNYKVRFPSSTETDPVGIVESAIRYIRNEELDLKHGDLAFCVIDTDTDKLKQIQIDKALRLADNNEIQVLLSNPCFEIWFLQHFRYSTKNYLSNDEVIRELTMYIQEYKKNANVFDILKNNQDDAIKRAKQLEKYHVDLGRKQNSMECNPSTAVYKIIEIE